MIGLAWKRWCTYAVSATIAAAGLTGCSHFRHHSGPSKYVYVTAKEASLRDRIAAVSNRTATVTNGEKLVVLDRARRFVKVKTPEGAVGWMEERLTADQELADKFEDLARQHEHDAVVANAVTRDDVYMHITPGRDADRFYRLSEGDTMGLLLRATVPKPVTPGAAPAPVPASKPDDAAAAGPPQPVMEDWWLARDAKGRTGWVYSRMIDVSAPDALVRYAEGQRIVGAYLLAKVNDPDSGVVNNGQTVAEIPEYVTVLAPYKAGLPYDFDQVRVFTWNAKKHRYETAFREHNVEGYLPVKVYTSKDPYGKSELSQMDLPTFSYRVLAGDAPPAVPDPQTGLVTPAKTITKTYRLEETTVHRVLPPGTTAPEEAHPVAPEKKDDKAKARKKR